mmetsp:Transcript_47733/g.95280  ORF Transcript_47733/g.95280 Transcript_47733/m.95280 type:complete len:137 (-) Transcript_47733:111-521(-)
MPPSAPERRGGHTRTPFAHSHTHCRRKREPSHFMCPHLATDQRRPGAASPSQLYATSTQSLGGSMHWYPHNQKRPVDTLPRPRTVNVHAESRWWTLSDSLGTASPSPSPSPPPSSLPLFEETIWQRAWALAVEHGL